MTQSAERDNKSVTSHVELFQIVMEIQGDCYFTFNFNVGHLCLKNFL